MTDASATLISFPGRSEDRLRLALRGLEAALDAQAAALAGLRTELHGLSGAVGGLEASLENYNAALGTTAEGLRQAGEEARALERSAEGWIAAARG